MKYLKLYENFEDDEVGEIDDIFLSFTDKYEFIKDVFDSKSKFYTIQRDNRYRNAYNLVLSFPRIGSVVSAQLGDDEDMESFNKRFKKLEEDNPDTTMDFVDEFKEDLFECMREMDSRGYIVSFMKEKYNIGDLLDGISYISNDNLHNGVSYGSYNIGDGGYSIYIAIEIIKNN